MQPQAANSLPTPSPTEQSHSDQLVQAIRDEIADAGGSIPFDRFMELALYAPGLGYYVAGQRKFGETGDFITAPETSPIFAQCLARQSEQLLKQMVKGELLEFGAGSGILAADLLAELERLESLPERYLILDISPDLRLHQQETLQQKVPHLLSRVVWINRLPEKFCGIIIANEVLDAMPVQRFRIGEEWVEEEFVTVDEQGEFAYQYTPADTPGLIQRIDAVNKINPLPVGYLSEVNQRVTSWIRTLAASLQQGAILLIDYGYPQQEFYLPERRTGTLMCHYRHRAHDDPFKLVGLQDITTYVDFSAVADTAHEAGLSVDGFTTQVHFLMGCGLDQILRKSDPNDIINHLQLMQGVKKLTLPSEMGERFKVLGLSRNLHEPPIGFSLMNMLDRL
ncbi:MAG: SAM-dependent methyltransferase [Candidatus Polarisedimenticolaceae bacterium]|nr:SAM-dependent methyltransferase [Candidatus Polarisedimenticolaceae bacterium]